MKYFVFVDETGNNSQERFFGLGALLIPVEKLGEYYELLRVRYDKMFSLVKGKESEIMNSLKGEELSKFLKGRRGVYEMKFKNINNTTLKSYKWLISQYFKFEKARYCCLVIDKKECSCPEGMSYFDIYLNQLAMLLRNNFSAEDEFVVLPDEISISGDKIYEDVLLSKLRKNEKNCFGVHRLQSHSSVFLQMVDVLTGAVTYEYTEAAKPVKLEIVEKIKEKLGVTSFENNFTKNQPNYFSLWIFRQ